MTSPLLAISSWDDGRLTKLLWRLYYYHYLILSYLILSFLILSYLILSYLILSYLIWSYLIGNFLLRWWEADKAFVKTFLSDPNLAPRLKAQCCKCLFISLTSLCLFNPLQHGLSKNGISSIFHKCFACPNVLFQNHDSWETNSYRNFCSATTMIDCSKLGQMYFSPYSL